MTGPLSYPESWTKNDEGTPVPRRTRGSVANGWTHEDLILVCHFCGDDYSAEPELPVGVVAAHFKAHHPDEIDNEGGPKITLDMLWLGHGPAPKGRA
jgi:hypothetical protein